ncbi:MULTISPECIES: sugar ABC transporter permease [Enterobacterales]|jgi:sn-glycerol 3-phosphate transport system permease protein|uniref:Sn-glycerol 3-phosphate transport system permease protein n=1 Tax=Candidatus Pantoea symbiotica TaxID=1884370 RepID=A0A1I3Q4Q0_9GAMM|nr:MULTISPECIES: sugar ABC transporter permease [Enterobacterales]MRT26743.1 ABC transporter permease subunit [Enterobacteriaceae bacterium RIT697]MRT42231.1 ABC transporter permease subunit [Enterobacteriaceae bacterium RIT702]KAJ9433133.1 sugar ABC transporter permease [Pantoea sp. YR343]MBB3304599.1 sn-glycerol 3-phosphate transport system permease protein [Enterobacter sp. Sphag1F]MEA5103537.1 sugar ABC transporter permease [Pantoea sp. S18]
MSTILTVAPVRRPRLWSMQLYGYLLILPALSFLLLFTHYPAVATVWESLFSAARNGRPAHFVGLDNYLALLDDDIFIQSLWNNLLYALITIPLAVTLALLMALAVNRHMRANALVRTAFFIPSLLPMIAIANLWLFFYTPQLGLLNKLLALFSLPAINWLGEPGSALYCLMAVSVWREAGFFMIFYLAALQQIDPRLSEAAQIEGASRSYFFRRVQWPLLMPTTLFVLINASMNAFRIVDQVIAMTNGGPNNSSSLLLFYIYRTAFSFWDMPAAAAMTVVLLVILAAIALLKFNLLDKRAHYQ